MGIVRGWGGFTYLLDCISDSCLALQFYGILTADFSGQTYCMTSRRSFCLIGGFFPSSRSHHMAQTIQLHSTTSRPFNPSFRLFISTNLGASSKGTVIT